MATVKKDINEESDQIKAVRKIVKKKAASLDDDKVITLFQMALLGKN